MRCLKCGNEMLRREQFCPDCGEPTKAPGPSFSPVDDYNQETFDSPPVMGDFKRENPSAVGTVLKVIVVLVLLYAVLNFLIGTLAVTRLFNSPARTSSPPRQDQSLSTTESPLLESSLESSTSERSAPSLHATRPS